MSKLSVEEQRALLLEALERLVLVYVDDVLGWAENEESVLARIALARCGSSIGNLDSSDVINTAKRHGLTLPKMELT